jgi:GWxTD domain-containing protein
MRVRRCGAASLGIVALVVAQAVPTASAQEFPVRGVGKPAFVVDARVRPGDGGDAEVLVEWEVPYRQLVFRLEDDYYRGKYDISIVLTAEGRQVAGEFWERRVRARTLAESQEGGRKSKGKHLFQVPATEYDVRITVTDRVTGISNDATARLDATATAARIGLSDLLFVRYTEGGALANPSRDVPVGQPGHFIRVTLHPLPNLIGTFRVKWQFDDLQNRPIAADDSTVVLSGEPLTLEIAVPSDRFTPGVQRFRIELEGDGRGRVEERSATLQARASEAWFLLNREASLEVFDIIAEADEKRALHEATPEEWVSRVTDFWKGRDPSPGTPANEYRESIQERMEAAATMFLEPFRRPGWRTDRGRILVKYGRPSQRTVRAGDLDASASELWEYESPRRVFFFVDDRGSGEFWLRT